MPDFSHYHFSALAPGQFLSCIVTFVLCPRELPPLTRCLVALALPLGSMVVPAALARAITLLPDVYDQNIAHLDGTLGLQPSAEAVWFLNAHPLLRLACIAVYLLFLVGIAFSAGYELRSGSRQGLGVIPTMMIAAFAGFAVYCYVPAIGPRPFYGAAYQLLLHQPDLIGGHDDFSKAPRNCVPSLHTAWTWLAFLATRNRPTAVRFVSAVFFMLTMLACLGLGFHYLVDLVVAAPFVLFIRALCAVQLGWRQRGPGALIGLGILLAWCNLIRGSVPTPSSRYAVPALMLATVVIAILGEQRLAAAERRLPRGPLCRRASSFAEAAMAARDA